LANVKTGTAGFFVPAFQVWGAAPQNNEQFPKKISVLWSFKASSFVA
jgi:hypothetical protein